jgi:acetyl esterase/lipase
MKLLLTLLSGVFLIAFLPSPAQSQERPFTTENVEPFLPEVRQANKQIAFFHPDMSTPAGLSMVRAVFGAPGGKTILQPQDKFIHGEGGKIRIRIFRPDTIRAVLFDIHGGGLVAGRPESTDSLNDAIARYCKVAVVSIDYRLAPENAFPAALLDCDSLAVWLLRNAQIEFGTNKLILSGYSAGAYLAALTLLDIRDKFHGIDKVIGINFLYGVFDLSGTPSARQVGRNSLIIDSAFMNQDRQAVFPGKSAEDLRSPSYSPLYANLKGLPSALFSVGTLDPLIDDTNFMSDRWEAAGNSANLYVYPECPHGFNLQKTQLARLANKRVGDWINGILNGK